MTLGSSKVLAIDLGASSGRCVLAVLDDGRLDLQEINRFPHGPVDRDGTLCWDIDLLWDGVREGLAAAFRDHPDIRSVGVDSWAVDFFPVDAQGEGIYPCVSYRDARTEGIIPEFLAETGISGRDLFVRTGIQPLELNSLFQLYAVRRQSPDWYRDLDRWMLLPDWFHWKLTGKWASEYTNATTTQMLDAHSGDWDAWLLEQAGLSRRQMPAILNAGDRFAPLSPELCERLHAGGDPWVVLPGTHDTASAVAALPVTDGDAYFISLGTWALVGREALVPNLSDAAYDYRLSNEGGVFNTYRQLRNVSGLWLIQRVRDELALDSDFADWTEAAEAAPAGRSLIHPADERFFRAGSMVQEIQDFCRETGQPVPESRGELARCIFESLALNFVDVLADFAWSKDTGKLHILGGGGRNAFLCQTLSDLLGAPVVAGPFEASAAGNAVVQMIGLGDIGDLRQARRIVAGSCELLRYAPRQTEAHRTLLRRYHDLTCKEKQGTN